MLLVAGWTATAAASPIERLASDQTGVTIRLTVPGYRLEADATGRQLPVVPGLHALDVPGRPRVPHFRVLLALPPGTQARARVVAEGGLEERAGVRLAIGEEPSFREDPRGGMLPTRRAVAAIGGGPWPVSPVEVGEPFVLRRQRMVALQLAPFAYDEATGRLWTRSSLTVRVDFVGGSPPGTRLAPAEDRHWEPVLREALLNYEQARSWRAPARPASRRGLGGPGGSLFDRAAEPGAGLRAGAFDESHPEVRVRVDSTGIYVLTFAELAAQGYPAGIDTARVSVHRHEFVEASSPPYQTIELPIEVDDRDRDGVFDDTDRIFVFVQAWAERARASIPQRAWGDAEVIYVTAVDGTGLRLSARIGWRGVSGLTPLASYPWTQRWERNFAYHQGPSDTSSDQFHWTERISYYDPADSFRFETNHIDISRPGTFAVTMQGRSSNTHFTWAQIRTCPTCPFIPVADSLFWSGKGSITPAVTLTPPQSFGEGNVNSMRVWGRNASVAPHPQNNSGDFIGVNYFDATYWRAYRALRGYLVCNSGDAIGAFQIHASGFASSDIRVYDVTDSLNPVRLVPDPSRIVPEGGGLFAIDFQDSSAGEQRRYIVFSAAKRLPADRFTTVTRRRLTERSGDADYLVVVPEEFLPAVQPLVALRQSLGLRVVVAPLESVQDEFNGGRKSSYAIRRFVRHAYDNWSAGFLLLVGDGNEDPLNHLATSSRDWIPIQKISGPLFVGGGNEIIPSDPVYGCVDNPCNLNDRIADVPDLFVGRLPVESLQQTEGVVAKLVAYENFTANPEWRRNLMLSADDEYSAETFFGQGGGSPVGYCYVPGERVFRLLNDEIGTIVADSAGLGATVLDKFYLSVFLRNEPILPNPAPNDTCRPERRDTQIRTHATVTPELISRLNAGRLWWNFQGHANEFVLCHEDLWLSSRFGEVDDKDQLMNDGRPFLFSAFSCHANAFARAADIQPLHGGSLGAAMVTLASRGAIGSWASVGYEILPAIGADHVNLAWARAMFWTPPHDEFLGDKGARVVLGETIGLALLRYVNPFDFFERGIGLSYHLLGDPGTRLSIGRPQISVAVNGEPVTDGIPVRPRTSGTAVTIEADLASNTQLISLSLERTDASGTTVIPASEYTVSPAFPDTAATGLGGRRYRLTYAASLLPFTHRYTVRTVDRYGVSNAFEVVFEFSTALRADGVVVPRGGLVRRNALLSLLVLSPKPLDPATDLTLSLDGDPLAFTWEPAPGDGSGREWILKWDDHGPYSTGAHELLLGVTGGTPARHTFQVVEQPAFRAAMVFPNPFDENGTRFSFTLEGGGFADLQIRVYTLAGRMVYERSERGLAPGYHQIAWNGLDAEGFPLANGTYLYRMLASTGGDRAEFQGRIVKLRKPRRLSE
jgi:peptidase C25-like protein